MILLKLENEKKVNFFNIYLLKNMTTRTTRKSFVLIRTQVKIRHLIVKIVFA